MSTSIAQTAVVDPRAKIGVNVRIGHFCVIGPEVSIGDNTRVEDHVVISGVSSLGEDNHIFQGCVIGGHPQDTSYENTPTRVAFVVVAGISAGAMYGILSTSAHIARA